MNIRGIIGLAMLLVECGALAYSMDSWVLPAIAALAGITLVLAPVHLRLSRDRFAIVALAAGALAALGGLIFPANRLNAMTFVIGSSTGLYSLALFALGYQLIQLKVVVRHPFHEESGPFDSFPFLGVVAISVGASFTFGPQGLLVFTGIACVFVLLTVAYFLTADGGWSWRRYGAAMKLASLALLLGAMAAGVLASIAIKRNEQALNTMLARLAQVGGAGSGVGYSRSATLSSITDIKQSKDRSPVLFAESETAPGYLRGLAFERYVGGRWTLPKKAAHVFPGNEPRVARNEGGHKRPFFRIRSLYEPETVRSYSVLTVPKLRDSVFLTPDTMGVYAGTGALVVDAHGSVRDSDPLRADEYRLLESNTPVPEKLLPEEVELYTSVPANLAPEVIALAAEITRDAESTLDRALAVQNYFTENYDYRIGIEVPSGEDPLTYFLLERPAAHCEYFASGATILLRLAGVPCRYVTGFVVNEKNGLGDYYVARNSDAHAWVEVWDGERGWFVLEATPAAGVPSAAESGVYSRWRDSLVYYWTLLRARLSTEPLRAVSEFASNLASLFIRSGLGPLLVLGLLAWWSVRYVRRRMGNRRSVEEIPEDVRTLHELLRRADGIARDSGLVRKSNETLGAFANRIRREPDSVALGALADWYRYYEGARYGRGFDGKALRDLESALPA